MSKAIVCDSSSSNYIDWIVLTIDTFNKNYREKNTTTTNFYLKRLFFSIVTVIFQKQSLKDSKCHMKIHSKRGQSLNSILQCIFYFPTVSTVLANSELDSFFFFCYYVVVDARMRWWDFNWILLLEHGTMLTNDSVYIATHNGNSTNGFYLRWHLHLVPYLRSNNKSLACQLTYRNHSNQAQPHSQNTNTLNAVIKINSQPNYHIIRSKQKHTDRCNDRRREKRRKKSTRWKIRTIFFPLLF